MARLFVGGLVLCYFCGHSIAWAPAPFLRYDSRGVFRPHSLLSHCSRRTSRTTTKLRSGREDDELWALDSGDSTAVDDGAFVPLSREFELLCDSQCRLLQDLVR
jgi:hypothetical protein